MSEPMATADLAPAPPAPGLQQSADGDFCIPAKRMKDGSVCFYVTIEHLIEQTLLRALNRPEFRKTPVVVKEDETLAQSPPPTPAGPSSSSSSQSSADTEPAAKVPSVPIKLQLKRKYREVAAGAEVDSSAPSVCMPEAKRQELAGSVAPPGRQAEGDPAMAVYFRNPAEPASVAVSAASPVTPAAATGQSTVGKQRDWHGNLASIGASGLGKRNSPSAAAEHTRSSTGSGLLSAGRLPVFDHRPPAMQQHRPSSVQLQGTHQSQQPLTIDDRFASRDQPSLLLLQAPPPEEVDVALDLSAKRPSSVSSSSPGSMAVFTQPTGAADAAAQAARGHDLQQSLLVAAASKELGEGGNHHQPALPSAMLLEHYSPFGHIFHHQAAAAAAAAAGSELVAMMHGADVKDWHHFSAAAALAAGRPIAYPMSSWPLSSPPPASLGMMQPQARTLASAAAAAATAASSRPLK